MTLSDKFSQCGSECCAAGGHTFEPPCCYRVVDYTQLKRDVLGTLPERLYELVRRTDNDADCTLLLSTIDRLDALAGDVAYNMWKENR